MTKNMLGSAAGQRSRFEHLSHVYKCVESGSRPSVSAGTMASIIFVGAAEVSDEDGDNGPASNAELTYLSLTLVRKITSGLMARSLPPGVAPYFLETLEKIFHELDLMSHLVSVIPQGVVDPTWEQICLQTFLHAVPGPELDACLWSLTETLKRLLKGAFRGETGKLLASFDSSLIVLCSTLLNEGKNKANARQFETTFCFLTDLLEALTASTLQCGAAGCLQCQKLVHRHSLELLKTISCSSEHFVKKRLLLLLKRVALQTAGEEWTSGATARPNLRNSDPDVTLLAQSVLTAVGANWLECVQVDLSSLFWGTGSMHVDASKLDRVVLRAVSLLLLKSIEIHVEAASEKEDVAALSGYLLKLWGFLKRHSGQLRVQSHLCCWVSLLFGEQDDDMVEAAKALLSVFLHYRQRLELHGPALLEEACALGYNPHCHFIFLLESVSFDHSFLLDLLISTETCFLEYLVKYLKCLIADWQGFAVACGRTLAGSASKTLPASLGTGDPFPTCKGAIQLCKIPSCLPAHPPGVFGPQEVNSSAHGLRLVDYSSSDESDRESVGPQEEELTSGVTALDITEDNPGLGVPVKQTHFQSAGLLNQPSDFKKGPNETSDVACDVSTRVLGCLSELKEVVMRLHIKKLFPYNPAPLLKLLGQVEGCSRQSHQ